MQQFLRRRFNSKSWCCLAAALQWFVLWNWSLYLPQQHCRPSHSSRLVEADAGIVDAKPLPNLAIFYNIFVNPDAQGGVEQGRAIVEEQINQIGQSDVMKVVGEGLVRNVTLYYTSIGHPSAVNQTYMVEICSRQNHLTCVHQQHFETGFELLTLQAMHDHCQNNEQDLAMYFHSKGSYHDSQSNKNWRKAMLSAITNRSCLNTVQTQQGDSDYCNLCGLLFSPRYTHDMPGNFFTGQCQYLKKLRPPIGYEEDLTGVNQHINSLLQSGHLVREHLPDANWVHGGGRFAAEFWSASHPSVMPCDMSPYNHGQVGPWYSDMSSEDFVFSRAPRYSIQQAEWIGNLNEVLQVEDRRIRDMFLLPGFLAKWIHLYNTTPPLDSWVWSFYPDGQIWKEGVHRYGNNVIEETTSKYVVSS